MIDDFASSFLCALDAEFFGMSVVAALLCASFIHLMMIESATLMLNYTVMPS